MRNACKIVVEKPEGKRPLGLDGRIILKWTFRKYGVRLRTGFIWLSIGTSGELL
jgi:hypothetical protein